MECGLVIAPAERHNQPGHPENPGRMEAIQALLKDQNAFDPLVLIDPVRATAEQIALAHDPSLIQTVNNISARGGGRIDADTYCTAESYDLARLAAGSVCALTDKIVRGELDGGLALVRPPGHHAEINRAMGFCLFNNIAVATRYVQQKHQLERVLIIDFDVHHGNGTQDIFYQDPSVLFISLHLFHPFFYPGTGDIHEVGQGEGEGYTVNVPFGVGAGDLAYVQAFKELIQPLAKIFNPELILVSAGFDAHWVDPLAAARLSLSGYFEITRIILQLAEENCQGKVLFCLEGGYHYEALSYGVLNVIRAFLNEKTPLDPLGASPKEEADMTDLLVQIRDLHLPD